jgi:hypothetical protein
MPASLSPPPVWRYGGIYDTIDPKRTARLRAKSGHRAWIKPGKRTLIVPVHSSKVAPYVVREVLEANSDVEEA